MASDCQELRIIYLLTGSRGSATT